MAMAGKRARCGEMASLRLSTVEMWGVLFNDIFYGRNRAACLNDPTAIVVCSLCTPACPFGFVDVPCTGPSVLCDEWKRSVDAKTEGEVLARMCKKQSH